MKQFMISSLLIALMPVAAHAQQKIRSLTHAEDFMPGHTMTYAAFADAADPGAAGKGIIWDFSKAAISDTVVQEIVAAADIPSSGEYHKADIVERSSDGMLLFIEKTAAENKVWGLDVGDLHMKYSVPYLFIRRPFAYGDSMESKPRRSYEAYGGAQGTGTTRTVADGQGKL